MKRQLQVPLPNFGAAAPAAFFVLVMAILPRQIAAEFEPPRIIEVTNPSDWGIDQASADQRLYVIDKGIESNMNKGDIVNVYWERRFAFKTAAPLRIFIGEITIIESHQGTSIGRFTVNDGALEDPMVRVKVAMEGRFPCPPAHPGLESALRLRQRRTESQDHRRVRKRGQLHQVPETIQVDRGSYRL